MNMLNQVPVMNMYNRKIAGTREKIQKNEILVPTEHDDCNETNKQIVETGKNVVDRECKSDSFF